MSSRRMFALAAGVAVLVGTAACGSSSNSSSSAGGDGSGSCPNGGTLRMAVEPFEDPARLTPAFQLLATAVGKRLHCKVQASVVSEYSAEVVAMRNDQLDVAMYGPLGFVFASQKAHAKAVASFGTTAGKLSTYTAGIWVPKNSPLTSVAQLKGRSLALSSVGSTSGDAFPRLALRQAGLSDSDVHETYAGGHPQSMLALTNGKVDAAEVNSQQQSTATAAGQFHASDFREIWRSAPIPNDLITVRSTLSPALQGAIRNALLHLPAADVAKLGALVAVKPAAPLVPVTKKDYEPVFTLAKTLGLTEKDA